MTRHQPSAAFGQLTLITGQETFLVEREMTRRAAAARRDDPAASLTSADAAELTPGLIDQMAGADLFSSATTICLTAVETTPESAQSALLALAKAVPSSVALLVSHTGGKQGKALLTALTGLAAETIDCPVLKPWELARFVGTEVRADGKSINQEAAQSLVDAVGADVRSLAAAAAQLVDDSEEDVISAATIAQYFVGRTTVTAYAISDDALGGQAGPAIVKLRWALSTGVPHVRITAAIATGLRQIGKYKAAARDHTPTAAEVGVPPWKVKDVAGTARSWTERTVSAGIRAVSQADAQIKGAAQDPDFALERLVLRLASLSRLANSA